MFRFANAICDESITELPRTLLGYLMEKEYLILLPGEFIYARDVTVRSTDFGFIFIISFFF